MLSWLDRCWAMAKIAKEAVLSKLATSDAPGDSPPRVRAC